MKRVIFVYIVVMAILLVGCKSSKINGSEINKTEDRNTSNEIENEIDTYDDSKSSNISDYVIHYNEYTANNHDNEPFKVKYIQISGLGNDRLESHINEVLKTSITEWINKDCEWVERFEIDVKSRSSLYLSLSYAIEWKNPQGEDFTSTFTRIGITVDMQTGERVYLDDLVEITSLKKLLENYDYGNEMSPPIDSKEADEIIRFASMSEKEYLEEIFKSYPSVYNYISSYMRTKPSFYLENNNIVITRNEEEINDVYITLESN